MNIKYLITTVLLMICNLSIFSDELGKNALLIANEDYKSLSALSTPIQEARSLKIKLSEIGFNVILLENSNKEEMQEALLEFEDILNKDAGIALFHYGGHAVQIDGNNYLLPVDRKITNEDKAKIYGLNINEVSSIMDISNSESNIVIIDACRNNPLPGTSRSGARGLNVVGQQPQNSVIVYSAQAGNVALDGLFTPALIDKIDNTSSFGQIIQEVRKEVFEKSNGRQLPGSYEQLFSNIYLNGNKQTIKQEQFGHLYVTFKETGKLFINNKEQVTNLDSSSILIDDLAPGDYVIKMIYPSNEESSDVKIISGKTNIINFQWDKPEIYDLSINSEISGDLYIDDRQYKGIIHENINTISLIKGQYRLKLVSTENVYYRDIILEANKTIFIKKLKTEDSVIHVNSDIDFELYVDDIEIENVGENTFYIKPGKHLVKLKTKSNKIDEYELNLSPGERKDLSVKLFNSDYGSIKVDNVPIGSILNMYGDNGHIYQFKTDSISWESPKNISPGKYKYNISGKYIDSYSNNLSIVNNRTSVIRESLTTLGLLDLSNNSNSDIRLTILPNSIKTKSTVEINLGINEHNLLKLQPGEYYIYYSKIDDTAPFKREVINILDSKKEIFNITEIGFSTHFYLEEISEELLTTKIEYDLLSKKVVAKNRLADVEYVFGSIVSLCAVLLKVGSIDSDNEDLYSNIALGFGAGGISFIGLGYLTSGKQLTDFEYSETLLSKHLNKNLPKRDILEKISELESIKATALKTYLTDDIHMRSWNYIYQ
ncbi:MAG: caspase family protein [Spirochaetaceae bacterium]